ncbi:uncharacterized protein LOC118753560, partial [Rhagoletis pomonella]|uniref:uncharacterized protein LOC118753560 n=1 Tax=Rhagoletis pomonella TaxID=28610 RepID=UPI00177E2F14
MKIRPCTNQSIIPDSKRKGSVSVYPCKKDVNSLTVTKKAITCPVCVKASPITASSAEEVDGNRLKSCEVLLPTAVITVDDVQGQSLNFRAFLDQGSQASFITERAIQQLRLPRQRAWVHIQGLAGTKVAEGRSCVVLEVGSRFDARSRLNVIAYVLSKVSRNLPDKTLPVTNWPHLMDIELADPEYNKSHRVDILLGSDVYDDSILGDLRRAYVGAPIAQKTIFGYILSGKLSKASPKTTNISSLQTHIDIDELLSKFWELEEVASEQTLSENDHWCEEFYRDTHKRLESGKYLVRLPLLTHLDPSCVIGSSKNMAMKRFLNLERRLNLDLQLKQTYRETIEEYLRLGQMEPVTATDSQHQDEAEGSFRFWTCCYLPHHPVVKKESSTTRVRIVFDASSCTSNGKSLNDILAVGPPLQTDLLAVLIKWRFLQFVFTTDIEKMYRCINVQNEDAQYQRILWRNEPTEEIREYFCNTVMFGTASAPFTAIRTMKQLASDEGDRYPLAVDVINRQMYVDDILSGWNSLEEAMKVQERVSCEVAHSSF